MSADPQPAQPQPTLTWAGDRYLRIAFGDTPDPETLARVHAAAYALQNADITGLREHTPAYTTILLTFDARAITPNTEHDVRAVITPAVHARSSQPPRPPQPLLIHVCYSPKHGADLEDLARFHNLTTDEVISLHSSAIYTVAFMGFTPGFPYLTGLPEKLTTPRLASPRPRIPTGSIGIAGTQTGIYPGGTPGGWRLIGRTPLTIFNASCTEPSLFQMGGRVRFTPISAAEFDDLTAQQKASR